jgi:lycopene beta-cyclase
MHQGGIMHFTQGEAGQILFYYLLPLSPTRALLEVTAFSPKPAGPDAFRAELNRFIDRRLEGRRYQLRRKEHGILPMGLPTPVPSADPTYVRAGLMAGGARASSGYAFQRIQRWAESCAQSLADGHGPRPHAADGWILGRMDALFLQVLRRRPELAPTLFLAMFRKVAPARLARFMSDQATLLDNLAVIAALPPGPFLRELFRPAPGVARP